jgi:hypothetical protein
VHEAGEAVAVGLMGILKGGFQRGAIDACAIGIDAGDLNNKAKCGRCLKIGEAAGGGSHGLGCSGVAEPLGSDVLTVALSVRIRLFPPPLVTYRHKPSTSLSRDEQPSMPRDPPAIAVAERSRKMAVLKNL